ncbi:unnamed protein product [Cylicocyclus nassatus]|uniref:Nucleolar complex protein 2 homolog n=1 Tax=Cylicocyclus nassatus TaxID=53992 RepID=A0AA36H974_CYLNA|nr:unnamed protein product [Cylicocyclus nassatus]
MVSVKKLGKGKPHLKHKVGLERKLKKLENAEERKEKKKMKKVNKLVDFEENAAGEEVKKQKKLKKKGKKKAQDEVAGMKEEESMNVDEGEEEEDSGLSDEEAVNASESKSAKKHLENLQKLKETDPEFYKFLQEQDADLLEFHASDEEEEEAEDEEEIDDEMELDQEKEVGKKPAKESRIPKAKKDSSGRLVFDGMMLNYLENAIDSEDEKQRINIEDIRLGVEAFNACVARVGADVDAPKYIINEQAVFYATVRLCFEKLGDAFKMLITGKNKVKVEPGIEPDEEFLSRLKHIKKYQTPLKQYLASLLIFANEVQTPDVIVSTLKAIRHIVDLYAHFKKITKNLSKVLVRIWSRKTLECRVGAYVCMTQLVKSHPEHFVSLYKSCYLGFVSNSREVTSETWPILHFMHKTFAELTVLHPNLAYPYAFVYIRQIAIHLRNAIISKKRKDMVRTIYNWQMMQCLYLWARVISKAHAVHDCEAICELTYPLTQLVHGVLKLYHSLRYIPLRLHCISILIQLQANCGVYIPTLTLAIELLNDVVLILAKKPKTSKNAKIVDMESSLKVAALTLEESSWRTALCDYIFRITLQATHLICSQPSFPDVIVPVTFRIRNFLRKIRSVEFARCFRALLEKMEEQAKFVADIILTKEFSIKDDMQVMSLKLALNNPDSPLRTYYRQWEKAWRMKQRLLLKAETKEKTKQPKESKKKKDEKKPKKEEEDIKMEQKPKKKRRLSQPAAAHADPTVPDQLGDLDNWSDSE